MMIACPATGTSTPAVPHQTTSLGSLRAIVAGAARSDPIVVSAASAAVGAAAKDATATASTLAFIARRVGHRARVAH